MPNGEGVPLDPHVVMNEILEKLTRIADALGGLDENVEILTDYAVAMDGALGELYAGKEQKRFTAASFLGIYGQIRDEQEKEVEADDDDPDEPGSLPGPATQRA